jgi:divalent metal cation (Fe/Co/Zn/Cd) transporter
LVAVAVAANIIRTGTILIKRSAGGLLDAALPPDDRAAIQEVPAHYEKAHGIHWHALRTRQAGRRRFVSVHVLVPGEWSVQRGHDLLEAMEHDLITALPRTTVFTHLQPIEDPASWEDAALDRAQPPSDR